MIGDRIQPAVRDLLDDCPPSGKLVFYVLAHEQPLTQDDIVSETRLPTVALTELESADVVESAVYIPDARKKQYRLQDTVLEATASESGQG